MSQHHTPPNDTSEAWDDDFEFQSNLSSRSSKTRKQTSTSSAVPPRPPEDESWDDAYEDEDALDRIVEKPPQVRSKSQLKSDTDEEMGSWGSGSDWSGDGDAEDLSYESYTGATSELPVRRSSSSVSPPGARFPRFSNSPTLSAPSKGPSTATSTLSRKSVSLFSRISPGKKWKARDADNMTNTKTALEPKSGWPSQQSVSMLVQKPDSALHANASASQQSDNSLLQHVFSDIDPPLATPRTSKQQAENHSVNPTSQFAAPVTPDLTFSPTSLTSTLLISSPPLSTAALASASKPKLSLTSLHIPSSKSHACPSTAIPSLSPVPSLPLLSSSAHNLPLSAPPTQTGIVPLMPRRSSLSDLKRPLLKIPERISRAQRDIKRDMDDVKDFAACVAQLKSLQHVYAIMLRDLRTALTPTEPSPSSVSVPPRLALESPANVPRPRRPSFSPKKRRETLATASPQSSPTKPTRRKFSLVATPPRSPDLYVMELDKLDVMYSIWWECAELLIELGGRNGTADANAEADADQSDEEALLGLGPAAGMIRGKRSRAVTIGSDTQGNTARPRSTSTGPPLASPVKPAQRRATTGRAGGKDLTPRQLALLRGMLETDASLGWDPRTAGGERGLREAVDDGSVRGKGKGGGAGRGIRYLWRGLKKGTSAVTGGSGSGGSAGEPAPRGSSSCDSSTSDRAQVVGEAGTVTSAVPKMSLPSKRTVTAADMAALPRRKQPSRRPSLAGIFGLGQKATKADADVDEVTEAKRDASSSDWDRVDEAQQTANTVRGLRRLKSKGSFVGSSIPSPSLRLRLRDTPSSPENPSPGRLSSPRLVVSSSDGLGATPSSSSPGDSDTSRRKWLLRGAHPPFRSDKAHKSTPDPPMSLRRLAFTPENIRPLLGHARDVMVHLNECINEVRRIISSKSDN